MKYIIRQPQSFSEIGRKDNQEDFLWPNPQEVTTDQRIFIMCDGVGGQENGEVASSTAATALGTYLTTHWPADGIVTRPIFEEALAHAYDALDEADSGESVRKMATTMTCVVLHRGGALVAHIGDSRIYHIRPSVIDAAQGRPSIIYESLDHSLVNDLLRVGEITEEEARDFPQKNVITRAMQPHGEHRCRADIFNIDDIKAGDYFFLCSDGVLEQVTNEALSSIVCSVGSDEQKIAAIKSVCDGRTRDNNTCWLVPIESVIFEPGDDERATTIVMASIDDAPADTPRNAKSLPKFPTSGPLSENTTPVSSEPRSAQAEAEEMSRTYERKMADIEKRQHNSRSNTILVACLAIAAVCSVFLYSRFTASDDPLKNATPATEAVEPAAEELFEAGGNVQEIMEEAIEEQAERAEEAKEDMKEDAAKADDKSKPEASKPTTEPSGKTAEQKTETETQQKLNNVLDKREQADKLKAQKESPTSKPANEIKAPTSKQTQASAEKTQDNPAGQPGK